MKKLILSTVLLFLLAGCSTTKLVYDYGEKFVSWQLDSYFDLNDEQEDWVEERMKIHIEWHRMEELPRYKNFLTDIQNSSKDGLTMSELDEGYSRYEAKQRRIFERLIPDAALFMEKISREQINNLERKMTEENEEMLTQVENRQERIQKRRDDFLEQMEDWFGEFSRAQLAQINQWQTEWFPESDDPIERRMKYRLKSQTQLLSLLRSTPDNLALEKWLFRWISRWDSNENSERKARILRNKKRILQVDKFISSEQRLHAIRELDDWVEILEQTIVDH
ncbi:MAG: DUF6279 family lipoprotein [SAR324 cluster bacterium]|nr:DUF6279 family lipoprotein [SAR324 cluster bacterium]